MPMGCRTSDEHEFFHSRTLGWNHSASSHLSLAHHALPVIGRAWSGVAPLLPDSHTLSEYKRLRTNRGNRASDRGSFGFHSGVRRPSVIPPGNRRSWAEPLPQIPKEQPAWRSSNRWQSEHLKLTSKHIPDRVPLPDKGKPVARRGRKATDQVSDLKAGLPEEE